MPSNAFNPEVFIGISSAEILTALLKTAVSQNCGFAAWRLPQQDDFFACISFSRKIISEEFQVETAPAGFIMHPFEISDSNKAYYFEFALLLEGNFREDKISIRSDLATPETAAFLAELHTTLNSAETTGFDWFAAETLPETASEQAYESLVKNGVEFLQDGGAEKVVLSRASQKELPDNFSPIAGFQNLTSQYQQAFISLVSAPETGTWLGASPEILVRKDQQNIFRTMALAGTQKLAEGQKPADAIWRQKEIEEQSMVVRYIISCFKKIRLREYVETGPRTVAAGNLLHLRSDFCVDLNQTDFPKLTTDMLHLLHPTSAVCGQPKAEALDFILRNEDYDRRYYSGYLGPVNLENETNIFVNLRCLELQKTTAILYAGAGITPDSEPEKEWLETQLKMQTVSAALQISTPSHDTATSY